MICFEHHPEIVEGVIGGVCINVVDDLGRTQTPPYRLFHYESVFHHVAFPVSSRMARKTTGAISATASVLDKPALSDRAGLSIHPTIKRAEEPRTVSCWGDVCATLSASVGRRWAPPVGLVAGPRAEPRRSFAAVLRVKICSALFTDERSVGSFHSRNVAHEEKYCEIAAERMAQEVLPL